MKLSFYPGCSLEGMANDYARSIAEVFKDLEIELVEIDDWSCCGSTAAHSLDQMMSAVLPARNLAASEEMGLDIVTPCAMCFNRLSFSLSQIKKNLVDLPWNVTGDLIIYDMTRFLAQDALLKKIKNRVIRPLTGLRVVCYYGCQMVRPPKITGFSDYENPLTLDRIAETAGARVLDWSYKSTCCGASIGIGRKEIQESLTKRILQKAVQTGAQAIIVSCPLCQSNLDIIQKKIPGLKLPIFYFTEILRLSFKENITKKYFKMHFTDPAPVLTKIGLME